jgi:hypothetical protein
MCVFVFLYYCCCGEYECQIVACDEGERATARCLSITVPCEEEWRKDQSYLAEQKDPIVLLFLNT